MVLTENWTLVPAPTLNELADLAVGLVLQLGIQPEKEADSLLDGDVRGGLAPMSHASSLLPGRNG